MFKQITVYIPNQPGQLLAVVNQLAMNQINIVGFHVCSTIPGAGFVQFVVEDHPKAFALLQQYKVTRESPVICLRVADVPGKLRDILKPLVENNINLLGAYQASGKDGVIVVLELESLDDIKLAGDLYAKAGIEVVEFQGET